MPLKPQKPTRLIGLVRSCTLQLVWGVLFFKQYKSRPIGRLLYCRLGLDGLVSSVRHQCHMAGELDRVGDHALMTGTELVAAGSADFKLSSHIIAQELGVLVINVTDIVFA